ncbi:hypothetical protein [Leptospira santarosai]
MQEWKESGLSDNEFCAH